MMSVVDGRLKKRISKNIDIRIKTNQNIAFSPLLRKTVSFLKSMVNLLNPLSVMKYRNSRFMTMVINKS